jgi:hypothetical protein
MKRQDYHELVINRILKKMAVPYEENIQTLYLSIMLYQ